MADLLPLAPEESFEEVTHQGKTIKVGDKVIVREAGAEKVVQRRWLFSRWGQPLWL